MEYKIIAIPILGFVIGYFTNYLAVKMLFYPRRRILGIQGVVPKRKKELAKNIGKISPRLMHPALEKAGKIPIIGEKILSAFEKSVETRVNSLSDDELEKLILDVARKELTFITWMGGVIGLLIGLLEVGILTFF